jgi:hypothetical protein
MDMYTHIHNCDENMNELYTSKNNDRERTNNVEEQKQKFNVSAFTLVIVFSFGQT